MSTTREATGARDQVARLLTLVPFLHHRDGVRLEEAASLLGTSPDQVLRDLKVLFMCGLPGGLPDDLIDVDLDALESAEGGAVHGGVIRVENADYLARPLRLSATEASAMIIALRMLRETSTDQTRTLVDQVLAKLESAAATTGAPPVEVAPSPRDAVLVRIATLTTTFTDAIARDRQVRLTYYVPSREEVSERVVDPRGVITHGVFTYLDGWCHRSGGDRLFRLDRIRAVDVLDTARTSAPRLPRDLSDGLFAEDTAPDSMLVTLLLAPQARWAIDYYPVREVRAREDGSAEVDLAIVDRRWLSRLLLRLAPHAKVLEPRELGDVLTATAQETLHLYRTAGA